MITKPALIEESSLPVKSARPSFALWNLGFRPFYLLASIFAAVSIPLWICQYAGLVPSAFSRGSVWHAHEMLFGYTLAVITGFLFTAVRTWTGHPTPSGAALAAFALLWIAGRVLVLTPYDAASTIVNAAFPVAVAVGIGIPLARSGNTRNYFFIAILLLVGLLSLAVHLSYLAILDWTALEGVQVGLDLVVFVMATMGGRVIPMFTNNGVPGAKATRHPVVEKVALASILALLVADLLQASGGVLAMIALAAAGAHAVRLYLWQPWRTLRVPMVWVLHVAYAWIVIYLALRTFAALGLVAEPLAVHALTIGGIGGLTMGMMSRTSRGHTGRPMTADRFEVACFLLVFCAAVIRVVGGLLLPDAYVATVIGSGICWTVGFALFAIRYWPVLSRARLDGKPG
ncbi:MAG: NnrS family protein [Casimicrobiaceae bacterium]